MTPDGSRGGHLRASSTYRRAALRRSRGRSRRLPRPVARSARREPARRRPPPRRPAEPAGSRSDARARRPPSPGSGLGGGHAHPGAGHDASRLGVFAEHKHGSLGGQVLEQLARGHAGGRTAGHPGRHHHQCIGRASRILEQPVVQVTGSDRRRRPRDRAVPGSSWSWGSRVWVSALSGRRGGPMSV